MTALIVHWCEVIRKVKNNKNCRYEYDHKTPRHYSKLANSIKAQLTCG